MRLVVVVALVGVVAVALVLFVASAGSGPSERVEPSVSFALPPPAASCDGASMLAGGGARVPLTVSTVEGQVAESVRVCIGDHGPFAFVLDSGAGQSTIDAGLAARLHLASAGPVSEFAGVGCTGQARPVSVGSWSLDGVPLAPQQLTAARLPQIGGSGEPMGLLGSDVLSRFGAVRVDFHVGALVLPGPEGDVLSGVAPVHGPRNVPPVSLTGGRGTTVPLNVTLVPGDVSLGVAVRFDGGARRQFVVDTGSSQSVVSTPVARDASLAGTDVAQRQATVCSLITVPLVHSGPWSVPGLALHSQLLGETDFGTAGLGVLDGLLGSDQLARYGWVVFDYRGAVMVLG